MPMCPVGRYLISQLCPPTNRTGDARIVLSLVGMQAAFAPVGAAMLVGLDVHVVELVMAGILVLVIVTRCVVVGRDPSKLF